MNPRDRLSYPLNFLEARLSQYVSVHHLNVAHRASPIIETRLYRRTYVIHAKVVRRVSSYYERVCTTM